MKRILNYFFFLVLLSFNATDLFAQQNPPRVVLQGFWWNYWNNNYPDGYYNYLTELAPRLKDIGIDAIWIPPSSKAGGTNDNGYGIFDHYDLGDKYQKGNVRTRLGTKDEYLRMVAVMHANGIDVIQDIVLNHVNGAGPIGAENDPILGKGGKDPNAPDNQWKNFRYTSFATPAIDNLAGDYLNRSGRWFKNYQNFHRSGDNSFGHNNYDYPLNGENWGPDICYESNAINTNGFLLSPSTYGLNYIYNPNQAPNYMKQQAIEWGVWLKKQTGVDGFRLDATKHYDWSAAEGFLWNLQYGTGLYGSQSTWANGTDNMFAVGEFLPDAWPNTVTNWIDNIQHRSGAFDFDLRDAIYGMVMGNGFYNIANLPSAQIPVPYRNRTVSFVNNHDTFRPRLDANGNYIGWYDGVHEASEPDDFPNDPNKYEDNNELRPHIDPFVDRLPAAYAIISSVDGSPQVFFEDLFPIGGNGKRWTHFPTNTNDLPVRDKIANIIWARRALGFHLGEYKVRSAEAGAIFGPGLDPWGNSFMASSPSDLLVIERGGRAIIGINDNGSNWQACWIDTYFPENTVLKDYSGANGSTTYTVPADGRVWVNVPPANAQYGGYVILGPVGFDGYSFNPNPRETTQEWEMANDLGDSHPLSLKQGGEVPDFGIWYNPRTVGRIFAAANEQITIEVIPSTPFSGKTANQVAVQICNSDGTTVLFSDNRAGTYTVNYTPTSTDYYTIKIYNGKSGTKGQKAFVKATYTAPQVVDVDLFDTQFINSSISSKIKQEGELSINIYPNPNQGIFKYKINSAEAAEAEVIVYNESGESQGTIFRGKIEAGENIYEANLSKHKPGIYYLEVMTYKNKSTTRILIQ